MIAGLTGSVGWLQEEDADFVRQKKRCQEFLNLLGQSQPHAIFANILGFGCSVRNGHSPDCRVLGAGDAAGVVREVQDFRS